MKSLKNLFSARKSEKVDLEKSNNLLCKQCQTIPLDSIFAGDYQKGVVFEEARSIADVETNVRSCALCRFVLRIYERDLQPSKFGHFLRLGFRKRKGVPRHATVKYSVGRRSGETLFGYEKKILRLTMQGRVRFCLGVQPFKDGGSLWDGHLVSPGVPNFQLIKAWIANCVSNHGESCELFGLTEPQHQLTNAFVVDVVDEVLRPLVLPDMKFVALSYVVGASSGHQRVQQCKFANLTDALPLETVMPDPPQTVKDAIRLVRMIGQRYLWVDCLSISGRDQTHRMNQIQQMHLVYSSALLSIIVADGADGDFGIPGMSHKPARITQLCEQYAPDRYLAEGLSLDETGMLSSVWNSRAWILQERLLSRRCLISCGGQFYWRCKKDAFCEDYPVSMKPRGTVFIHQMPFRLDRLLPQPSTHSRNNFPVAAESAQATSVLSSDSQVIFAAYCWAVAEYMQRKLTFVEDVNIAFRGIEMLLAEYLGTTSWWSLPQSLFHRALLWYPGYANVMADISSYQPLTTRCSKSASYPSWAWCGWIGSVTYFSPREYAVSQGGRMTADLFLNKTKMIPTVAWSRYKGSSRIVINHDYLVKLISWTSKVHEPSENLFRTDNEHRQLNRSLEYEMACSTKDECESTAPVPSYSTYIFTYAPIWCLSRFSVSPHPPLENFQLTTRDREQDRRIQDRRKTDSNAFIWDQENYGYMHSAENIRKDDIHMIVVSRAEIGELRPRNVFDNWLSQCVKANTFVYDVLYIVFDETGEFRARKARRIGIGFMSGETYARIEGFGEWREVILG